ncbi:MAG TPA: VTT domain-containing protein [Pseudonocardia sp.]|nr:VTT domain-containing protein [Pseudonocardia sp.]
MSHPASSLASSLAPPSSGTVLALGPQWLDPSYLISALGPFVLVGLCLIIFAECGLLVGFFLPGDSLLFTAGLFVASGAISTPLWLVCTLLVVSALLGNVSGYWIGRAAGPAIFDRPNSRLLKPEHVERTHAFFERYGNRAIVLGRFVPIVRTFITVMAGVGKMEPKRYLTYSVIGGVAWAAGVTLLGYLLGGFTFVREHIELMLIAVVVLSLIPLAVEFLRARRERRNEVKGNREVTELG